MDDRSAMLKRVILTRSGDRYTTTNLDYNMVCVSEENYFSYFFSLSASVNLFNRVYFYPFCQLDSIPLDSPFYQLQTKATKARGKDEEADDRNNR